MRPDWDEYFLNIANEIKLRSTCMRRSVGAVIVKDNRILATGYNGAPIGTVHCLDKECLREKLGVPSGERHEICRAIHAEQNAIIQAAKYGTAIEGGTLYCTNAPCSICAKMIINAGIKRIVCNESYNDSLAISLIKEANVELIILKNNKQKVGGI